MRSLLAAAVFMLACAQAPIRDTRWPVSKDGAVEVHGAYFMINAAAKPDPKAGEQTQRRSTSRDAAIIEARQRLITFLSRIMLSGISVGERALEDPAWQKRLDGATSGFEVAETKWDEEDRAAVVLRVEKAAVERALGMNE